MAVKLPGAAPGAPKRRMLVLLTSEALKLCALPAGLAAASAEEAAAAVQAEAEAAEMTVACDAFLHRKGTGAGAKERRDMVQVVLLRGLI